LAFTRNPSDTSVTPATYTADGASSLFLDAQPKDIAIDGSDKSDTVAITASKLETRALTNYNVRGFAGDDIIDVAGSDLTGRANSVQNSVFNGNIGDDTLTLGTVGLTGGEVDFKNSFLLGGKGDDSLTGDDVNGGEINGNIGNDTIKMDNRGKTGVGQYIGGGQGNDAITVSGNYTDSIIDGNKGIDTIIVEDGTHSGTSINGGEGDDVIRSSGAKSKGLMLSGDKGNDTVVSTGSLGSTIFGGEGNDTLVSASAIGETSTIDAGVGADFVGTETSAAVETIIFNKGDSVAATASSLGTTPGAAISGTITFGKGIDIIAGLTGFAVTETNDLIDIDFKPAGFENANGLANTATLATDKVYQIQGTLAANNVFTVGTAAGVDTDFIYVVGGGNLTLGQVFTNSTDMFISGALNEDQFV
jgi:hypothetical protein